MFREHVFIWYHYQVNIYKFGVKHVKYVSPLFRAFCLFVFLAIYALEPITCLFKTFIDVFLMHLLQTLIDSLSVHVWR